MGYGSWDRTESDTTERLSTDTHTKSSVKTVIRNRKKTIPRLILIKLLKTSGKEESVKAPRGKKAYCI